MPQLLVFNGAALAAHDPGDGRVLWRQPWPRGTENVSQPVLLPGDRVFLASGYDVGARVFEVSQAGGGLQARTVWESRGLKAKFTNLVFHDGYIFGLDDGVLTCLDPATGETAVPADYSALGGLLIVVALITFIVPLITILAVQRSPFRTALAPLRTSLHDHGRWTWHEILAAHPTARYRCVIRMGDS